MWIEGLLLVPLCVIDLSTLHSASGELRYASQVGRNHQMISTNCSNQGAFGLDYMWLLVTQKTIDEP